MKISMFLFVIPMIGGQAVTALISVTNPFVVHPYYGFAAFVLGFWGTGMFFYQMGESDGKLEKAKK